MYLKREQQLTLDEFIFPFGKLDKENRWVKLSNEIPWAEIEEIYAKKFVNNGNKAKSVRIALGSLIIKQILNCSDVETVAQVKENPYLQFFVGMREYSSQPPFSSQSMTDFRKRFSSGDILEHINSLIIEDSISKSEKEAIEPKKSENSEENDSDNQNSGTIAIDATCAPADISYPQDIKLLSDAREKTEKLIDKLQEGSPDKKPRTYRQCARRDFLNISKSKRKTFKAIRKGIKKQINYLSRNFKIIESLQGKSSYSLSEKELETLEVLKKIHSQQTTMIQERKHSVPERIVSISQPYVRPIPRGKTKASTEFGAKVEISIQNGFARIETLSFEAYNEGKNLIPIIEKYRERNGFYPARVLVDKLYRNRENIKYCKKNGISITGPALGRPKKDAVVDKKAEYQDISDRNCVEGKFGEGKTTYGLGRISARLKSTSISVIGIIFMVMNLQKKVRLSFVQILIYKMEELFRHHEEKLWVTG